MHRAPRMQSEQQSRTTGFTLIELLVVISIIAILSALLLGGIQAARLAVANAKAGNELNSISTALAQFHSEFGQYPPSSITLYANATGDPSWQTDTQAKTGPDQLDGPQRLIRSRALIRKLWPDFDFTKNRPQPAPMIHLDGRECLVFFLGGMMQGGAPIGFSKNPSDPFNVTGSNRVGPFHEFVANRFVDTDVDASGNSAPDSVMEYLDTYSGQAVPILYVSSYDGRGYRSVEVQKVPTLFLSNGVYRQGSATGSAWKSKTYQLISPGQDTIYGTGGWYDPDGNGGISDDDKDNVTNFTSGKLK